MLFRSVLLLFFNRMDCLRIVLERLREIRPERLYLAADGPRHTRPEEASLCKQTRDMALEMINWQCCVKTLFRDHNLGCGRAVSEAISWFFENESEGIIIEDDCLLDTSFFRFAAEMLERYRNDERIALISALNIAGIWASPFFDSTTWMSRSFSRGRALKGEKVKR